MLTGRLPTGEYDVHCFVRGNSDGACTRRLRQTFLAADTSYPGKTVLNLDGVTAIPSDITQPQLGLKNRTPKMNCQHWFGFGSQGERTWCVTLR